MANAFQNDPTMDLLSSLASYQWLTSLGVPPAAAAQQTGTTAETANAFNLNGADTLSGQNVGGNGFGSTGYGFGQSSSISAPAGVTPGITGIASLGLGQNAQASNAAPATSNVSTASVAAPSAFGAPSAAAPSAQTNAFGFSPDDFSAMQTTQDIAAMQALPAEDLGVIGTPAALAAMAELGVPGISAPSNTGLGAVAANQAAMGLAEAISNAQSNPTANATAQAAINAIAEQAMASQTSEDPASQGQIGNVSQSQSMAAQVNSQQQAVEAMMAELGQIGISPSQTDESPTSQGQIGTPSASLGSISDPAGFGAPTGMSNLGFGTSTNLGITGPTVSADEEAADEAMAAETASQTNEFGAQPAMGVTSANPTQGVVGPTNDSVANAALAAIGVVSPPSQPMSPEQQAEADAMFGFAVDAPSSISNATSASPPGMSNLGMSSQNAFGAADDGQTSEAPGEQGSVGTVSGISDVSANAFGTPGGEDGTAADVGGYGSPGGYGGVGAASDVGVSDNGTDFGGASDVGGGYGGPGGDVGGMGGMGGGYGGPGGDVGGMGGMGGGVGDGTGGDAGW